MTDRHKVIPAVYLVLVNSNEEVLLQKRQGTGYCDGMWGMVSGHIEAGESMVDGMIREAKEEAGFNIPAEELQFGCMLHRKSDDGERVDLFFVWEPAHIPEIRIKEPEKCAELKFFSIDELPDNVIPYVEEALECCGEGNPYFEYGWDESER